MTTLVDFLVSAPLLTVFVVIGVGTAVGQIRLGPIRFGAAGALFVGLAIGALDPRLGEPMGLLRSLGLALFCYTVGIGAGNTFFRNITKQLPIMLLCVGALVLSGVAGAVWSHLTGVTPAMDAGAFAGALTSPVLDAAIEAAGSTEPAVGYALAYPVGVTTAIVIIALLLRSSWGRRWPSQRDLPSASAAGIRATTIEVLTPVKVQELPGFARNEVRLSYLERQGHTRVIDPEETLEAGDRVVVVGSPAALRQAEHDLGSSHSTCLAKDRSRVDFRRLTVSSYEVAGHTIAEVDMPGRFNGVITRVKRADRDILAHDDFVLELGDRVLAVVPSDRLEEAAALFGDSEKSIATINAFTVGLGMALGLALGMLPIPMPGGITLKLGVAAGPLVVGMILGRIGRSGPFVWGLPHAANSVIRQLGLLFFLAAIGLASGPDFAASAFSLTGVAVGGLAAIIIIVNAIVLILGSRLVGLSVQRAAGALAGLVGQPAILSFALGMDDDERIETGYATLFALAIVVKIVMVQVLVSL